MNRQFLGLGAAIIAGSALLAAPSAKADWHGGGYGHGDYRGWNGRGYWDYGHHWHWYAGYGPGYGYYGPPPVYYAPPPEYYAPPPPEYYPPPPPVYYAPPPAYFGAPGVSIGIGP